MAKPIINDVEFVEKSGQNSEADKWIKPVESYVSSSFGERINPIRNKKEFHNGIDLAVEKGTPVLSIADGEILETGSSPTWGRYVKYKISDTYTVFYAHLNSITVKKGRVKQGEELAKSGNTGLSTGAHLHFTIYENGKEVDPLNFYRYRISGDTRAEYIARGEEPPK